MHKHFVRIYFLALDLSMLILLLAAPDMAQDKAKKPESEPSGTNPEFKSR